MAEISAIKNLKDADVGISGASSRITVTSEAMGIFLRESNESEPQIYSDGDFTFIENGEGYTLVARGKSTANHVTLSTYAGSPITEIADEAFLNDSALLSITIPATVKRIGKNAFKGSALQGVTFEDSNKMIIFCEKPAGWNSLCLNYNYTNQGEKLNNIWPGEEMTCWDADKKIFFVAIPLTATDLIFNNGYDYSAPACQRTLPVTSYIKNNLKFILKTRSNDDGEGTHYTKKYFYAPQNFDLHESLTIDNSAFNSCTSLMNVTIPGRTVMIGDRAFQGCNSLQNLAFTDNGRLTHIGVYAFSGTSLVSATMPEGLATMEHSVFMNCTFLEDVSIPSTLETLEIYTFYGCRALVSVDFRENSYLSTSSSLKKIGPNAFQDCTSLDDIYIPPGVTIIGAYAFSGCTGLKHVYMSQFYGWFVSKDKDPDTTNVILIKPTVLEWTYSGDPSDEREAGPMNAACLLSRGGDDDSINHNNTDLIHMDGNNSLHFIDTGNALEPYEPVGNVCGYANYYWHRRIKMPPPKISISGSTLTMTDPLGVAENFWVYVNGGKRCQVLTPLHPEYSGSGTS